ncbi:MAG: hypothetical protein V1790_08780 [Planctomycetota bacterium]
MDFRNASLIVKGVCIAVDTGCKPSETEEAVAHAARNRGKPDYCKTTRGVTLAVWVGEDYGIAKVALYIP